MLYVDWSHLEFGANFPCLELIKYFYSILQIGKHGKEKQASLRSRRASGRSSSLRL